MMFTNRKTCESIILNIFSPSRVGGRFACEIALGFAFYILMRTHLCGFSCGYSKCFAVKIFSGINRIQLKFTKSAKINEMF